MNNLAFHFKDYRNENKQSPSQKEIIKSRADVNRKENKMAIGEKNQCNKKLAL